jgi:hypothetical protein
MPAFLGRSIGSKKSTTEINSESSSSGHQDRMYTPHRVPLKFHDVRGANVRVTQGGRIASRVESFGDVSVRAHEILDCGANCTGGGVQRSSVGV